MDKSAAYGHFKFEHKKSPAPGEWGQMPGGDGGLNAQPTGYSLFQKVAHAALFKEDGESAGQRRDEEPNQKPADGHFALPVAT